MDVEAYEKHIIKKNILIRQELKSALCLWLAKRLIFELFSILDFNGKKGIIS